MGKFKLRFLTIALGTILLTLFTQPAQAYYSTAVRSTNVVTFGDVRFEIIHEYNGEESESDEIVYIKPGEVVEKRVFFESTCKYPFYLRVKMVNDIDSQEIEVDDWFRVEINPENWYRHSDGWIYYRKIVHPGDETPEIFSAVEILGDKMDNSYLGKILKLTVKAQAVQSEYNNAEYPWYAQGWPEE